MNQIKRGFSNRATSFLTQKEKSLHGTTTNTSRPVASSSVGGTKQDVFSSGASLMDHLRTQEGGSTPYVKSHNRTLTGSTVANLEIESLRRAAASSEATMDNAPDPGRVEEAVTQIRGLLYEGGFDPDVSYNELQQIQQTFQGLNREDFNATMSQLSDTELQHLCSELNSRLNGFSVPERQGFYRDVLRRADSTQSGRFAKALESNASLEPERKVLMGELGEAVSGLSMSQQASFLEGTRSMLLEKDSQIGRAAMHALNGMGRQRPGVMAQQLGTYNEREISALVEQSTYSHGSGVAGHEMDTTALQGVIQQLSAASPDVKARMFRAVSSKCHRFSAIGRQALEHQHSTRDLPRGLDHLRASRELLRGIGGVLQDDSARIMESLRRQDPSARQLGQFFSSAIDLNERQGAVDAQTSEMLQGIARGLGDSSQNGLYFAAGLTQGLDELQSRLDWDANVMATSMSALEGLAGGALKIGTIPAQAATGFFTGAGLNIFNTAFAGYMNEPIERNREELRRLLLTPPEGQ